MIKKMTRRREIRKTQFSSASKTLNQPSLLTVIEQNDPSHPPVISLQKDRCVYAALLLQFSALTYKPALDCSVCSAHFTVCVVAQ